MRYLATLLSLALLLAACHTVPRQTTSPFQGALSATSAAISECRAKRLAGELKTFAESVACSNPRIVAAFQSANYPYMDLVGVYVAARAVGAEHIDRGELTEAEFNLQLAELYSRLNTEAIRRDNERSNAQSQARMAGTAEQSTFLQGLKAFQRPPLQAPGLPITCTTYGNTTTCQ